MTQELVIKFNFWNDEPLSPTSPPPLLCSCVINDSSAGEYNDELVLQRKTAPGTEPVASVWTSRAAAGARTPVTPGKVSASRVRTGGLSRRRSRPRPLCPACPPTPSPPSMPACVPARPGTTGPSSTAQVGYPSTCVCSCVLLCV